MTEKEIAVKAIEFALHTATEAIVCPACGETLYAYSAGAFAAGAQWANEKNQETINTLKKEIEILRLYGNKDCTAMADEILEKKNEN